MRRVLFALFAGIAAVPAFGQLNATGSIAYAPNGNAWNYNITLNDTGTTTVGTLWYSWIPGEDFMAVSPTNVVTPANWSDTIINSGAGDGYSIEFVAAVGHELAAGSSLSGFQFTSTSSPAQLAGNSNFYTHPAVGTSYVYSGQPFSDGGHQFIINPVPEPITMIALAPALLLMRRRRSR